MLYYAIDYCNINARLLQRIVSLGFHSINIFLGLLMDVECIGYFP